MVELKTSTLNRTDYSGTSETGVTFTTAFSETNPHQRVISFLPCDDGAEAVEFLLSKYDDGTKWCEINFLDSYCGERESKLRYRIKRAWKAFTGKPMCYSGVCVDDVNAVKKWLLDCASAIDHAGEEMEP